MRQSRFLDDMGQVLAALLGTAASARGQMRGQAQQRVDMLLQRLGLVGRDEFDALHDMLKAARMAQTRLESRIDALERGSSAASASGKSKKRVNEKLKKSPSQENKSAAATRRMRKGR